MNTNKKLLENVIIFSSGKNTSGITNKNKSVFLAHLLNGPVVCSFLGIVKVSAVNENRKGFL